MTLKPIHLAAIMIGVALQTAGAGQAPVIGSVQAISGRFSGVVRAQDGKLLVDDRELRLEDALYLMNQVPAVQASPTNALNALRLDGGDYWRVDLLKLSRYAIAVNNPELGQRRVELTSILAIEFAPDKTTRDMDQPETMYRDKGAPLPGSLVWLKETDVAVQSLLGVLPLPRSSLVCYVMRSPSNEPPPGLDELCMIDGSLYHGRLGMEGDQITLEHPVGATIKTSLDRIRYFSRTAPRIQWLSSLPGKFEAGVAPLGKPAIPEMIAYKQGLVASPCMQALRIQPASVMRYTVPAAGGDLVFQATIAPRPSNAGDVLLQMRVDNRDLLQRTLVPSGKPEAVVLPLAAGKSFEIIVAYGDRLALPAEVDICDPFVRAK